MKKRFFGIKIGTIFSTLLCLIAAVALWFFVKYSALSAAEMLDAVVSK